MNKLLMNPSSNSPSQLQRRPSAAVAGSTSVYRFLQDTHFSQQIVSSGPLPVAELNDRYDVYCVSTILLQTYIKLFSLWQQSCAEFVVKSASNDVEIVQVVDTAV